MSFSRACPVAFRWLAKLTLENLAFEDDGLMALINACDKLKHLILISCGLVDRHSALKIDTPCSDLEDLWFIDFDCKRIELISVPNLRRMWCCSWPSLGAPVHFGHVPQLRQVDLGSRAAAWQPAAICAERVLECHESVEFVSQFWLWKDLDSTRTS
ncbi:hypothetical protein D1007_28049 [Hordeum vulgare]|nr:hypothetical protein D1007_28049 [Hordeum vulgare]